MKVTINATDLPMIKAAAEKLSSGGTILDKMLAKRGTTRDDLPRFSKTGKALRRDGVPACGEFQRISALPRRVWHEQPDLEELVDLLTEEYKTPEGTQRLWPIQAVALCEIADTGGLVGGIRVSGGKTLVSLLAPTVLDAKRAMIFVPSKSIRSGKCQRAYDMAREHWRIRNDIQFVSYEMLQTAEYVDLLEKYRPDIVIADEAHKWRRDSARSSRAKRFREGTGAQVPFILLSGTLMAGHIVKDVAKLCDWALGAGSPAPRTSKAQKDWADALEVDSGWNAADGEPRARMAPGALLQWCEPEEKLSLDGVRRAYGRRYTQTPGVIVSSGDAIGQTLTIECHLNAEHDKAVEDAFVLLRGKPHPDPEKSIPPKAPDGWILVDAPVIWQVAQCLELGFYYRPNPRPPEEWTLARQAWASYCRERIRANEADGGTVDSELRVANECRAMDEPPTEWTEWIAVRDSFELQVEPVWLSERRVDQAGEWLKKHEGLCWTQFKAFGQKLSQKFNIPFFASDACDIEGNSILEYPGGPAIVSVAACSEDLDGLQDKWHRNLYVCPMSTGQQWEQSLARTHRVRQRAEEVIADVWVGCIENHEAIEKARAKESAVAIASLDDARKLLVAEWVDDYRVPYGASRRWSRPHK